MQRHACVAACALALRDGFAPGMTDGRISCLPHSRGARTAAIQNRRTTHGQPVWLGSFAASCMFSKHSPGTASMQWHACVATFALASSDGFTVGTTDGRISLPPYSLGARTAAIQTRRTMYGQPVKLGPFAASCMFSSFSATATQTFAMHCSDLVAAFMHFANENNMYRTSFHQRTTPAQEGRADTRASMFRQQLGRCSASATVSPVATYAATTHCAAARERAVEHHHWHAWKHVPCKEAPNILHNDIGASRAACLPYCPKRSMQ